MQQMATEDAEGESWRYQLSNQEQWWSEQERAALTAHDRPGPAAEPRKVANFKFAPHPEDWAGQRLRALKDKHNEREARRKMRRKQEKDNAAAAAAAAATTASASSAATPSRSSATADLYMDVESPEEDPPP